MTDLEQWELWLNKWSIPYEVWDEYTGTTAIVIGGVWAFAEIQFEKKGKFICLTKYE